VHFSQDFPRRYQLLNGGGWWDSFSVKAAVVVGRLVDAFNAGNAQHRQVPGEICELLFGQNGFGFWATSHERILACSLFVRY
jgi:hypothetical protein